jgi:hypothetical protein
LLVKVIVRDVLPFVRLIIVMRQQQIDQLLQHIEIQFED